MTDKMQPDYSTINLNKLRRLPVAKIPPTYRVSRNMGAGCYGDAPGYPSYFLQSVYTQYGNAPRNWDYVIYDPESDNYRRVDRPAWRKGDIRESVDTRWENLIHSLWIPLPLNHYRVEIWEAHTYIRQQRRYLDPTITDHREHWAHDVWWPMSPKGWDKWYMDHAYPERGDLTAQRILSARKRNESDSEFSIRRAVWWEEYAAELSRRAHIAYPENHAGYEIVRRFYPDAPLPDRAHLTIGSIKSGLGHAPQADWWERYAERPTSDNCPGWNQTLHKYAEGNCRCCGLDPKES